MSKFLFSAVCLSISILSHGQDYIVTQKADTIKGKIKLLSYDLVDRVQITVDKKKTTYTALQLRRASIDGEQFAPVRFDNSIRMMKIISSGFLSLYAYRGQGQGGYDTRILQKVGQNAREVPNIGFKRFLGELVADCPTIADKLKTGDFERSNVQDLVDQYNVCIREANQQRLENAAIAKDPAIELIDQMKVKVEASDLSKKTDVNELLNSIGERYKKKEAIPAYMKDGLKDYIGSREDLKGDMEKLFTLIDKK